MIYLDSASTTLQKPPQVGCWVGAAVNRFASPGRGGYPPAAAAGALAYRCRSLAGDLFQVEEPERVVFTSSATHGLNLAIRTLVKPGSRVVISGYEHNAVTRTLESIPEVSVTVLAGRLFQPEELVTLLEQETAAGDFDCAIFTYVSNVFGYVLPIPALAAVCSRRGIPLIVDAAQGAGIYPVRMKDWGTAYVAMPGHKGLYGPQGIGLLLCGQEGGTPLLTGGTGSESLRQTMPDFLPDRWEAGTHNMPGIAGLYQGMQFVRCRGVDLIRRWEEKLKDQLVQGLIQLPGVQVFSGTPQAGVVSFQVTGRDCEVLGEALAHRGIALRAGLHCAPLAHRTAGTLDTGTLRVSFSAFNTPGEVATFLRTLRQILRC